MSPLQDVPAGKTEAEAIIDVTREAAVGELREVDPRKVYSTVVPEGFAIETVDFEYLLDVPKRMAGTVTVQTVDDFAGYVSRHDDQDGTTVWVDIETAQIIGVLDDHRQEGPGWGDHRALLRLKATEQWAHWAKLDGQLVEQEKFADHIEDGLKEIVEPSGPTMLEVVQTMQGATKADWKSAKRLQDGSVSFLYHEDATATAGGNGELDIPATFKLGMAPFLGEDEYAVTARLRYRVSSGKLQIGYKLDRPGDVVRDAIDQIAARLAQTFTDRVFIGKPRA